MLTVDGKAKEDGDNDDELGSKREWGCADAKGVVLQGDSKPMRDDRGGMRERCGLRGALVRLRVCVMPLNYMRS